MTPKRQFLSIPRAMEAWRSHNSPPPKRLGSSSCSPLLSKTGTVEKFRSLDEDWHPVAPLFDAACDLIKRTVHVSQIEITMKTCEPDGAVKTIWLDDQVAWQATSNRTAFNKTEYVVTSFLENDEMRNRHLEQTPPEKGNAQ